MKFITLIEDDSRKPVHIRSDFIIAVGSFKTEHEEGITEVILEGGARVWVLESPETVMEMISNDKEES